MLSVWILCSLTIGESKRKFNKRAFQSKVNYTRFPKWTDLNGSACSGHMGTPCEQTDRHNWKHYLLATSLACDNNNNKTIKPFFGVTKTITCFRKVNAINSLQNIWNQQHCQDLLSIEFPCCGPCSRPVGVTVANLGPTYTEHQR